MIDSRSSSSGTLPILRNSFCHCIIPELKNLALPLNNLVLLPLHRYPIIFYLLPIVKMTGVVNGRN
jgi:hypothetical protein